MSRIDIHTRLILCVAAALVTLAGLNSYVEGGELTWPAVNTSIKTDYPQVRHLTTADLVVMLQSDSTPAPTLLDVRQPDEFGVSHLQGALLAPELSDALETLAGVDKSYPIVVYCSVGYRSGALAAKLQENGYTNVYNLEGSIFMWANEGRPVYAGGVRVYQVHPYDTEWGVLLDRRFWPGSFE
jgi:rhodanese-related sulfurtransferase